MRQSDQLQLKILYEDRFVRQIRPLFNRITKGFRVGVATGRPVRASFYNAEWVTLLNLHYRRVQTGFRGAVKDNVKQDEEGIEVEDLILIALLAWAEKHSKLSAERITETTQENMDDAVRQARQAFSDDGVTVYTDRELALVSATILRRKFKGREETIATTETQSAAESTKLIEAFGIGGLVPLALVTGERTVQTHSTKKWVTMGDKRVRDTHLAANGQRRELNEPFLVGGYFLKYPGDMSLGADLGEIINCRCSASYTFKS